MCTAAAPLTSATPEFPHGAYDKELRDRSVNFKGLRGIRNYDITDPNKPELLEEFNTGEKGNGTHHNFYDGGKYAYLDCGWDDQLRLENHQRPFSNAIMIVDMSDPGKVKEVSRWWVPGQRLGEEAEYKKYIFAGDRTSWTGNHGALSVPKRVEDGGKLRLRRIRRVRNVRHGSKRHHQAQAGRQGAVRIQRARHHSVPHLLSRDFRCGPSASAES